MQMILKDKMPSMMKGYPTKSDKYNVMGGILEGTTSVQFGQLVAYGDSTGYYKAITSAVTVDKIAGFVLATNVKLADEWPAKEHSVKPHEAFNLVIDGWMAVELESSAVIANIKPNKCLAVDLTNGKLSTSGVISYTDLPNVVFTGMYEVEASGKVLAEVRIK